MGIIFFHYNFLFLTTILTLRFVLLDERTARKSPNSCRFVLLEGVLLDEFDSSIKCYNFQIQNHMKIIRFQNLFLRF